MFFKFLLIIILILSLGNVFSSTFCNYKSTVNAYTYDGANNGCVNEFGSHFEFIQMTEQDYLNLESVNLTQGICSIKNTPSNNAPFEPFLQRVCSIEWHDWPEEDKQAIYNHAERCFSDVLKTQSHIVLCKAKVDDPSNCCGNGFLEEWERCDPTVEGSGNNCDNSICTSGCTCPSFAYGCMPTSFSCEYAGSVNNDPNVPCEPFVEGSGGIFENRCFDSGWLDSDLYSFIPAEKGYCNLPDYPLVYGGYESECNYLPEGCGLENLIEMAYASCTTNYGAPACYSTFTYTFTNPLGYPNEHDSSELGEDAFLAGCNSLRNGQPDENYYTYFDDWLVTTSCDNLVTYNKIVDNTFCDGVPVCGNGIIEAGEECEAGPGNFSYCLEKFPLLEGYSPACFSCICVDDPTPTANSIIDLNGSFDVNLVLNVNCLKQDIDSNAVVSLNGSKIGSFSDLRCPDLESHLNKIDLGPFDVPKNSMIEVKFSINQPCTVCSRTIYLSKQDSSTVWINIPDNNFVVILLVLCSVLFLVFKKK